MVQKTLGMFHFDQEKSGRILKDWAKESGLSYQELAKETGITYDTVTNSLSGKIKELNLERVFKLSVATGHSVCEYIRLMMEDEDIDFGDRVLLLVDKDKAPVPYTSLSVPDTSEVAGLVKAVEDSDVADSGILNRFRDLYARMIDQLNAQHAAERKSSAEAYKAAIAGKDDVISRQDKQIKALTRKSNILGFLLGVETVFIAVMLAVDILNPSRGWILRSILNFGSGNGSITKG